MINLLSIFIGGGIGSIFRHLLSSRIGNHWGVLLVNILGAMLIGVAFQFFVGRTDFRPEVRAFIITGMLGGFTTFSTYMLDFGTLVSNQRLGEALLYLLGSLFLGIAFLYLGIRIAKIWW